MVRGAAARQRVAGRPGPRSSEGQGGSRMPYAPPPRNGAPPPPQTKVTTVGENEIYNRKNFVGPILVHKFLGPRPSLSPCPPSYILPS